MKTKLSGLVDDELERHDEQVLLDAMQRGEDLRGCWREYLLIGAALRRENRLDADITGRVMAALEHEPAVLSPRRVAPRRSLRRPALALAATLAGVGVVVWVALVQPGSQIATQTPMLVQREAPATQAVAVQPVRQPAVTAARDMREYLAAHQMQSGFLQFRGGTENIRTVSAAGKAPAP